MVKRHFGDPLTFELILAAAVGATLWIVSSQNTISAAGDDYGRATHASANLPNLTDQELQECEIPIVAQASR